MKRILVLLLLASASLFAATTTVSQSVVLPNGSLANGTALIRITVACTSGSTYIGQQTVATTLLGGAFSVNLAPNDTCTPRGTSYSVSWMICGAATGATTAHPCPTGAARSWSETWVVPTSSDPVTISSVLISVAPAVVTTTPLNVTYAPSWGSLPQNGALPGQVPTWNGTTWAPSAGSGMAYTAPPSDGQYVRFDATRGAWQPVTFVDQETVAGTLDGTNVTFTVANAPSPGAGLVLFRNGLAQMAGQDYTLSGNTITFVTDATPQPDDTLIAWYRY